MTDMYKKSTLFDCINVLALFHIKYEGLIPKTFKLPHISRRFKREKLELDYDTRKNDMDVVHFFKGKKYVVTLSEDHISRAMRLINTLTMVDISLSEMVTYSLIPRKKETCGVPIAFLKWGYGCVVAPVELEDEEMSKLMEERFNEKKKV